MAHTVIMQATIPGTTATISIAKHSRNALPYTALGEAPITLGGNWSCDFATEQEARNAANEEWNHIVSRRDKAAAQAASAQEIPGLPGVTVADAANLAHHVGRVDEDAYGDQLRQIGRAHV